MTIMKFTTNLYPYNVKMSAT